MFKLPRGMNPFRLFVCLFAWFCLLVFVFVFALFVCLFYCLLNLSVLQAPFPTFRSVSKA